jgi:hypothetical protein
VIWAMVNNTRIIVENKMRANVRANRANLESTWSVDSKLARFASTDDWESTLLAVTSQTGSAARLARARHTCGVFLKKCYLK